MYIYSYIYMEKHHFALHTKNEVTSISMGTQSFCELILRKAGQTTWSFIWKKILLILQQDQSILNLSVSRTWIFPPNWKHCKYGERKRSGSTKVLRPVIDDLQSAKVASPAEKGFCDFRFGQSLHCCQGRVSISRPLHTHRFCADVRVVVTQLMPRIN